MSEQPSKKTWTEEIEVAGNQLVGRVQELIEEGAVRRLVIRKPDNTILLEIPFVAGAAIGGAALIFAPVLAAVGALAALIAQVKLEIVREVVDVNPPAAGVKTRVQINLDEDDSAS